MDVENQNAKYQALPGENHPGTELKDLKKPTPNPFEETPAVEKKTPTPVRLTEIPDNESLWAFFCRKEVPKKAVFLAFFFMVVGLFLFIVGFSDGAQEWDPFNGFLFWGTGFILGVPGVYFCYKVVQAYRAKDLNERNNILREIPDM